MGAEAGGGGGGVMEGFTIFSKTNTVQKIKFSIKDL